MCGSCEAGSHSGITRWTSTKLLVIAFVAALVALSIAGLVLRLGSSGRSSAARCSHLVADSTTYQTTVTRDLRAGSATLVSDTNLFVEHARAQGGGDCAELRTFTKGARSTLRPVCPPCADILARAFDRTA